MDVFIDRRALVCELRNDVHYQKYWVQTVGSARRLCCILVSSAGRWIDDGNLLLVCNIQTVGVSSG